MIGRLSPLTLIISAFLAISSVKHAKFGNLKDAIEE
jgi:hypothetical protein